MSNTESKPEVHWLVNLAQELRDNKPLSLNSKPLHVDPDLSHPAVSTLCELADRCGSDIPPEFLRGYAFGLRQVGLIDDVVLEKVDMHTVVVENNDPTSHFRRKTLS